LTKNDGVESTPSADPMAASVLTAIPFHIRTSCRRVFPCFTVLSVTTGRSFAGASASFIPAVCCQLDTLSRRVRMITMGHSITPAWDPVRRRTSRRESSQLTPAMARRSSMGHASL
jgi:hypothetical protein